MATQIYSTNNSNIFILISGSSVQFRQEIKITNNQKQIYLGNIEISQKTKNQFSKFNNPQKFKIDLLYKRVSIKLDQHQHKITFYQSSNNGNKIIGNLVLVQQNTQKKLKEIKTDCQHKQNVNLQDIIKYVGSQSQIILKQQKQIENLRQDYTKLSQMFQRTIKSIYNNIALNKQQQNNKFEQIRNQLKQQINESYEGQAELRADFQKYRRGQFRSDQQKSRLMIYNQQWVDKQCPAYKNSKLEFESCLIKAKQDNVLLFGSDIINKSNPFYKVTIGKIQSTIRIGIASKKQRNKIKFIDITKLAFCQNTGDMRAGNDFYTVDQGDKIKFKEFDRLCISIDFQNRFFKCSVNGRKGKNIRYEALGERNAQWVPFVHFKYAGDSISLSQ